MNQQETSATEPASPAPSPPSAGPVGRRPVTPEMLPGIMRRHIITGCMGTVWGTLIGGIVFIYFGNAIGMSQFQWGLLGAIGAWVVLVQPLGALLGSRVGSRKMVWFWFALAERVVRLAAIVGAFLAWRAGLSGAWIVLVVLVSVSGVAGNMSQPPWWGWLATIIPREVQGAFWGRRDTWTSIAVISVILPATFLLDRIPAGAKTAAVFGVLAAATVIGLLDILIHAAIPEPPMPNERGARSLDRVLKPLRDRRFRPWLTFAAAWNFSRSLGGSLCLLYFMENLGLKDNLLGGAVALNVLGLVGSILSARRMGRLVDRWGSRRMLFIGHLFWSLLPGIWLFATPHSAVFWISVSSVVSGVFSTAANNAGLKLITRFPPAEESAMYMAVSSSTANIAGGLGSLAAGVFLQLMGGWTATVGGLVMSAFPLLFLASFVLRLASAIIFVPRIREQGVRDDERPMLLPLFFGLPIRRRKP